MVAGWQVPMWIGVVAFVIGGYVAYEGLQIRKRN